MRIPQQGGALESHLFATLGYGRTAHKSLIQLHPISTSGAPCSLGDNTNCSARTWGSVADHHRPSAHYCFTSKLGISIDQSSVYPYSHPAKRTTALRGQPDAALVADAVTRPASQQLYDACDFQEREGPLRPSWAESKAELAATLGTRVR